MSEENYIPEQQKESVKLTKNAKGFYQWEIKILEDELEQQNLDRLEALNKELNKKFGADNGEGSGQNQ